MHEGNRDAWNRTARTGYGGDVQADVALLRSGGDNLMDDERRLLGGLRGRVIHLQCSRGLDALGLLNRGAEEVVGIVISDEMIRLAQAKSDALGAPRGRSGRTCWRRRTTSTTRRTSSTRGGGDLLDDRPRRLGGDRRAAAPARREAPALRGPSARLPMGSRGLRLRPARRGVVTVETVPEPATLAALGLGLAAFARRRRRG